MENKLIIKTTVTESKEVEKEISLPHYSKKENFFYFTYADQKTIKIFYPHERSAAISTYDMMSDFADAINAEPCTEQEFCEAYTKALETLSQQVPLWITARPLPTPEEFGLDPNGNEQQRDINLSIC